MKEFELPFEKIKATLNDAPVEPTIEITENGTHNVKGYTWADVNVEGGSSDFSTANVTLDGGDNGITLVGLSQSADGWIFIRTDENGDTGSASASVDPQHTAILKALLFKNFNDSIPHDFYAFFEVTDGSIASVDGNCENMVEEGGVLIWGDCTITAN